MFKVMEKRCDECLFSKLKLVSNERRKDIIQGCLENDSHLICHKSSIKDQGTVCCRGFYETFKNRITICQLGDRLGVTEFVPVPDIKMGESL